MAFRHSQRERSWIEGRPNYCSRLGGCETANSGCNPINLMTVKILREARDDLIDGFCFYEKQEQGLGDYFLTNLESDIESLALLGDIHAKSHKKFHRSISKRFPFAIYYGISERTVLVRAVIDCRKKPSWIREKIRGLKGKD